MRLFFLFLTLNLFALTLHAQKAMVSGTLIEKESGEPLPGVKIYEGDRLLTVTDANGAFTLAFEKGTYDFYAKLFSSRTLIHVEIVETAPYNLGPIPLDIEDEGAGFRKSYTLTRTSKYLETNR